VVSPSRALSGRSTDRDGVSSSGSTVFICSQCAARPPLPGRMPL
jgi:hypothetical protein